MPTRGTLCLLAILVVLASACVRPPEPVWYKPGGDYTTAEFRRDREACTRGKTLDPRCLRAKGWIPVRPDRPVESAEPEIKHLPKPR